MIFFSLPHSGRYLAFLVASYPWKLIPLFRSLWLGRGGGVADRKSLAQGWAKCSKWRVKDYECQMVRLERAGASNRTEQNCLHFKWTANVGNKVSLGAISLRICAWREAVRKKVTKWGKKHDVQKVRSEAAISGNNRKHMLDCQWTISPGLDHLHLPPQIKSL